MHLTEAETAAGANLLCRHKRLEDPGQDFRRDPRPVIGDLDYDIAAGKAEAIILHRLVLRRNAEQAAAGHRIPGVEAEIEEGQLELARIDFDDPEIVRDVQFQS